MLSATAFSLSRVWKVEREVTHEKNARPPPLSLVGMATKSA